MKMDPGIKLYDAISEPVADAIDKIWLVVMLAVGVAVIAGVILLILRKFRKGKK